MEKYIKNKYVHYLSVSPVQLLYITPLPETSTSFALGPLALDLRQQESSMWRFPWRFAERHSLPIPHYRSFLAVGK